MFAGITPCPRLRVATSFGSTYEVAATWFSALVIIDLQLRPVPVAILAGKIPVAVCCRTDRINVSSRVAISTFAEATRSVSCAIDAESRNAATVTMIANPITEIVRTRASPRSFLLRSKDVLVAIRTVKGCQKNSARRIKSSVR